MPQKGPSLGQDVARLGPRAPSHGAHGKAALPTDADSVFRTVSCGSEASFAGQRREQTGAGFDSERNVWCESDNVSCRCL